MDYATGAFVEIIFMFNIREVKLCRKRADFDPYSTLVQRRSRFKLIRAQSASGIKEEGKAPCKLALPNLTETNICSFLKAKHYKGF